MCVHDMRAQDREGKSQREDREKKRARGGERESDRKAERKRVCRFSVPVKTPSRDLHGHKQPCINVLISSSKV